MKILLVLATLAVHGLSHAALPSLMQSREPEHLVVHNRILANVNGQNISVMDVMKKMDLYLARAYPQIIDSKIDRYQFYLANWYQTLQQMIDQELMIADADEKELKVNDANVRETMVERFGTNMMLHLDKLNMTYEEARKLITTELTVQQMTWYRVNNKAIQKVAPQDVKAAYKEYCEHNPPIETWKYQVLSIRAGDAKSGSELAERAHHLLAMANGDLQMVASVLKSGLPEDSSVTITVSPDYEVEGRNLSDSHKEVLFALEVGSFSKPISQLSRVDNSMVHRLFYLRDHTRTEPPAFDKIAGDLHDKLLEGAVGRETAAYITKLRHRFGYDEKHVQEMIPEGFRPFSLK
jgi:hypothetical protein